MRAGVHRNCQLQQSPEMAFDELQLGCVRQLRAGEHERPVRRGDAEQSAGARMQPVGRRVVFVVRYSNLQVGSASVLNFPTNFCFRQVRSVWLARRSLLGHVSDLRQPPGAGATANREDRDVGRGRVARAAVPALLHHDGLDRRAVSGH